MQSAARNQQSSFSFPPAPRDDFETLKQSGLNSRARGSEQFAIDSPGLLAIERDSFDALYSEALALHAANRLQPAAASYLRALEIDPNSFDAHHNLGLAYFALGETLRAVESFTRALSLAPNHVDARYHLAVALQSQGRQSDAIVQYEWLLAQKPDHVAAHLNLGVAHDSLGRLDAAANSYRRVLSIEPGNAAAHCNLGMVLEAKGDMMGAMASYLQARSLDPDLIEAHLYYVDCKKITAQDADLVESIERFLLRDDLAPDLVSHLHAALGKCYDDLGQYPKAFGHFSSGHQIERARQPFDSGRHAGAVSELIHTFDRDFFRQRAGWGNPSAAPIFIVGMPRSGTTLIEQIVSSHGLVFGAGELDFWSGLWELIDPVRARQMGERQARATGDDYVELLQRVSSHAARVIDKMPQNFFMLGLIRLCLPNARIIHVRRDPLDTCVSIYSQKFAQSHPYAHDLGDLAAYYEQYRLLMRHWNEVLPGGMLEVDYEDLVHDQEAVTRRILDYCGLEWDARCLDFQQNDRAVVTASAWQVRQPMYTSSIGRWRNYGEFIAPLSRLVSP